LRFFRHQNREVKSIYQVAIRGAYFGILNSLFVFFPFLYSLLGNQKKLLIYCIVAGIILISLLLILILYRKKYNYSVGHLRYLLFAGSFNLVFYLGYIYSLFQALEVKIFTFDAYILLLYLLLSVLSSVDILSCAFFGYRKIRWFYTRTYQRQTLSNVALLIMGILFGAVLILPQYLL